MKLLCTMQAVLAIASAALAPAAQSYIVVDNQTGMILASKKPNDKLQVASLTKIATAMVALDWAQLSKADLSQMAVISPRAVRAGGINPVGLQEGDSLSLRDLLYTALMASDNVAATALAEFVGARLPNAEGLAPASNFVSHMNALAHTLGMKRTLFLNPSGSDNVEGTLPYSTASDMARLTRYAYSEADFPFFVSQKSRIDSRLSRWCGHASRAEEHQRIAGSRGHRRSEDRTYRTRGRLFGPFLRAQARGSATRRRRFSHSPAHHHRPARFARSVRRGNRAGASGLGPLRTVDRRGAADQEKRGALSHATNQNRRIDKRRGLSRAQRGDPWYMPRGIQAQLGGSRIQGWF